MKMEISVRCRCGSTLTFDDAPVNGALQYPIACTNCGADCTVAANEFIRRKLNGEDPCVAEGKSGKGWLGRFGGRRQEQEAEETPQLRQPPTPLAPPPPPLPNQIRSLDEDSTPVASDRETGDETEFKRLILAGSAALLAGVLGAIGWFYVVKLTGYEIGYVAWALGGLVGWASRLVAPRGNPLLGVVATLAALLAIGGGQCLVSRWVLQSAVRDFVPAAYEEVIAYAKEVETAQTAADKRELAAQYKVVEALAGAARTNAIAAYQNYQIADSLFTFLGVVNREGQPRLTFAERERLADAKQVTAQEMARFDTVVTPELKKLAAGQVAEADYQAALENQIYAQMTIAKIVTYALSPYTLLWLFLGLGTAYRIARNAGLQY